VVCSGNESLSLQGQTISIADGTAVTALGNCTLRLTAATIVGQPALVIQDNAHVIIEGGTFTTSGGTALRAQGNATVEVTSATITGNITIQTSGNAQVRLQQSTIIGDRTAIQATSNSKVDARGSSVQGRVSGRVVQ
jgi:hypothetical protein